MNGKNNIAMVSAEKEIKIYDIDELLCQFSISLRSHSRRVAVCSAIIAEYAKAFMSIYDIPHGMKLPVIAHFGGTCHDLGMLLLPGAETNREEYLQHPKAGADLLEKYKNELLGDEPSSQMVIDIVRYHHERCDGGGFPEGLKGGDIPLIAGICSIADMLDHFMYSDNLPVSDGAGVCEMLEKQANILFCECVWVGFKGAWPSLKERYDSWSDLIKVQGADKK